MTGKRLTENFKYMANNRLWAVCRNCNAGKVLMKYYAPGGFVTVEGSSWYFPQRDMQFEIEEFLQIHDKCAIQHDWYSLMNGDHIAFITEDDQRIQKWESDGDNYKIILAPMYDEM